MEHLDALVTLKVGDVESENALNAVNVHGSDEPRVVSFFAQHAIGGDQPFPLGIDIVGFSQEVEKPLSLASPSIANRAEYPKPFTSRGRVATTQASIKLCLATHIVLPCLKRSFMALRACVEAG